MPLRATAIVLSLLLHGLVGHAMWLQFQPLRLEALDLGEGQDIILEPQGMDLSEVANVGDALQSIETQGAVPVDQSAQPPPSIAPLGQPQSIVDGSDAAAAPDVAALAPQEFSQDPARMASDEIGDVAAPERSTVEQDLDDLDQEQPPLNHPSQAQPEQVRDVIAAEESTVEQELVAARTPPRDRLEEQVPVAPVEAPPTDDIKDPEEAVGADASEPDPLRGPEPAIAAEQPAAPEEIREADVTEAAPPAPPEPVREAALDSARKPLSPPTPIEEEKPDVIAVVAQPEHLVIVTEQSSGKEHEGGDASIVRIYLGKVNEQVQRSKVNPRSRTTGVVLVRFTIGTDGSLLSKDVVGSSGAEVLDQAAIAALERAAPFPPIPAEVSATPMTFKQSFRFMVR